MTAPFKKNELEAQITSIKTRIDKLGKLPTETLEESESNGADLQKLNAVRSELLEKMQGAPE